MDKIEEYEFEIKKGRLKPILIFTLIFFFLYYSVFIIPVHGISSKVFLNDNLGGLFIVIGFILSLIFTRNHRNDFLLMLPSFGSVITTCFFLMNKEFYEQIPHLWLSAQIIGIVYSMALGSVRTNILLFGLNISLIPLAAFLSDHVNVAKIVDQQAITYFSSLIALKFVMIAKQNLVDLLNQKEETNKQAELAQMNSKLASIGVLAAGVAHEINNPLAIANGNIQRLKRTLEKDKENIEKINLLIENYEVASERIQNIVVGMKNLSRTNSLEISKFDVSKAIRETASMLVEIYKADDINLNWSVPERETFLEADYGKFNQIVMNLLSNAKDAVESNVGKEKRIEIVLKDSSEKINISVSDNGHGIPEDVRPNIFDTFFTTKEVGKGSGMGLSLSYSFVEQFGGTMTFESSIDKGTTFYIQLPLA